MAKPARPNQKSIANFIYESGVLARTPRSGLWLLGTGSQSVAEHTLRNIYIGFALAKLTPRADIEKVVMLCLFHDLGEARASDLNYVHQMYAARAEEHAVRDLAKTLECGGDILTYFVEAQRRATLESRLAKDADNLEWIATLREEETKGNKKASAWVRGALTRLKTVAGKRVGRLLVDTHPDDWWFHQSDTWFQRRHLKNP